MRHHHRCPAKPGRQRAEQRPAVRQQGPRIAPEEARRQQQPSPAPAQDRASVSWLQARSARARGRPLSRRNRLHTPRAASPPKEAHRYRWPSRAHPLRERRAPAQPSRPAAQRAQGPQAGGQLRERAVAQACQPPDFRAPLRGPQTTPLAQPEAHPALPPDLRTLPPTGCVPDRPPPARRQARRAPQADRGGMHAGAATSS